MGQSNLGQSARYAVERITKKYPGVRGAVNVIAVAPASPGQITLYNPTDAGNRDLYDIDKVHEELRKRNGILLLMCKKVVRDPLMPDAWTFPGVKLEHCDDVAVDQNNQFTPAMMGGIQTALPERAAALRALYTQVGLTVSVHGELMSRKYSALSFAGASHLVPMSRWVSSAAEEIQYDTLTVGLPIPYQSVHRLEAMLQLDKDVVEKAAWMTPEQIWDKHCDRSSGLKLPPPELLMIDHLCSFKNAKSVLTDARDRYTYDIDSMPRVQPFVEVDKELKQFRITLPDGATHLPPGEHSMPSGFTGSDETLHHELKFFIKKNHDYSDPLTRKNVHVKNSAPIW